MELNIYLFLITLCIGSLTSIITSLLPLFLLSIGTGNKQYTNDGLTMYSCCCCCRRRRRFQMFIISVRQLIWDKFVKYILAL